MPRRRCCGRVMPAHVLTVAAVATAAVVAGCRATPRVLAPANPTEAVVPASSTQANPAVPAVAPDSTPRRLFDSLGVIRDPEGHGMPWVRGIVVLLFQQKTQQPERAAVVARIHGVVVGGFRISDDGTYYVRIPGTTQQDILRAIATAKAFPQVESASPFIQDSTSHSATRRPSIGS